MTMSSSNINIQSTNKTCILHIWSFTTSARHIEVYKNVNKLMWLLINTNLIASLLNINVWVKYLSLFRAKRFFSSSQRPDWLWCPPSLLSSGYPRMFSRGESGWAVKLTTHLQLVLRSRIRGSIHPFPHLHGVAFN
jgi:hypothetical protein